MPIEVQNNPNVFYTTEEVASTLDVGVMTVYRYIRSKKLLARKVGKEYRISAAALHKFMSPRTTNN